MIDRREIMDFSREFGLAPNVVEKDYVLGWLMASISNHAGISSNWVFKGGTCLKKCYFETYRFSEDLDFTLTNADHLNKELLLNIFREVSDWVYDTTGIEIPRDTIRFDVYTNLRGALSVQGKIGYIGPLQQRRDFPRIKLDLTNDEILVLEPVTREVHHPYSDRPNDGISAQCYGFEELFAEKIRALGERQRPRDLYDVIHLYRHDAKPDRSVILSTLKEKCRFKEIDLPTVEFLVNRPEHSELKAEWKNMLAHQLPVLPPFEQFWQELPKVFEWLYHDVKETAPPSIPAGREAVDLTWHVPAMIQAWHTSVPMEVIRFAAANRLCVDLDYIDADGKRIKRIVEPYSLRKTREGNLLLHVVKHDTGETRSYRVDRIKGAVITEVSFIPRYAVELTSSGPVSAPPAIRSAAYKRPVSSVARPSNRRPVKGTSDFGPKHVFECTLCGKRFTHKSYDSSLNQHKDKHGYPCPGRVGIYITAKY